MIVSGQLTDSLGACVYEHVVPVTDPYERQYRTFDVRSRYELEETEIRSIAADCPVTDQHRGGRVLGHVRHAEITQRGDCHVVLDMHSLDVACSRDGDLFLSLEGSARDGRIDVTRVVLTARPAQPLKPVKLLDAGTVSDVEEAVWLRMRNRDAFTAGLLERARAAVRDRAPGAPIRVHDQRPPEVQKLEGGVTLINGEPVQLRAPLWLR